MDLNLSNYPKTYPIFIVDLIKVTKIKLTLLFLVKRKTLIKIITLLFFHLFLIYFPHFKKINIMNFYNYTFT